MQVLLMIFAFVAASAATFMIYSKITSPNYRRLLQDLKTMPIERAHYPYPALGDFKTWSFWVGKTQVHLLEGKTLFFAYGKDREFGGRNQEIRLHPFMMKRILKNRGIVREKICKPWDGSSVAARIDYYKEFNFFPNLN